MDTVLGEALEGGSTSLLGGINYGRNIATTLIGEGSLGQESLMILRGSAAPSWLVLIEAVVVGHVHTIEWGAFPSTNLGNENLDHEVTTLIQVGLVKYESHLGITLIGSNRAKRSCAFNGLIVIKVVLFSLSHTKLQRSTWEIDSGWVELHTGDLFTYHVGQHVGGVDHLAEGTIGVNIQAIDGHVVVGVGTVTNGHLGGLSGKCHNSNSNQSKKLFHKK